jgi:hypothetical protein
MAKKNITREEAIELYSNMSNDELMDEFMNYSVGDDWGGDYTTDGLIRRDVTYTEMISRLRGVGFLSDSFVA